MQNDPAQTNQFGGTQSNQLGTYPIPPSILAEDQQTKLQNQQPQIQTQVLSQPPNPTPDITQITQTPLSQPEPKVVEAPQPAPITSHLKLDDIQPEPVVEPVKIKSSPSPIKLNQPKNPLSLTPPVGSPEEADHYINTLIKLLDHDKIEVSHTDLKQFDPSTLQDHYKISFEDYEIEISHGKSADSDKEFYVLLFIELDSVQGVCTNKTILAYTHLSPVQFGQFKNSADGYLNKKKIAQEHERFVKSLTPINDYLDTLTAQLPQEVEEPVENDTDYQKEETTEEQQPQILDDNQQYQPQDSQPTYDPNDPNQPDQASEETPVPAQQLEDNPSSDQSTENYNSPYLPN